jgi:cysteine desulfurase / selenocysteine lyase
MNPFENKLTIDIQRARQETPGCHKVLHFNNAGAALMPKPVSDVITQHLERETMIGAYEAAEQAQEAVATFYRVAAQLIHCTPEEIAFAENATRAWEMVFYALPFQRGDRILTTVAEYASNYIAFLQVAKKIGVQIDIIPNDEFGQASVNALEKMIDKRVKLISVTHIPTQGGLVNPGVLARSKYQFFSFLGYSSSSRHFLSLRLHTIRRAAPYRCQQSSL